MSLPRLSAKEGVILELLAARGEMYGLELVEQSGGHLKRGTVYVTLGRMEDKGLVRSRLEERLGESGPPRRLYEVTGLGFRVKSAAEAAEEAFHRFRTMTGATTGAGVGLLVPVAASADPRLLDASARALGTALVLVLLVVLWTLVRERRRALKMATELCQLCSGSTTLMIPIFPGLWAETIVGADGFAILRRWRFRLPPLDEPAPSRVRLAPGTRLRWLAKAVFTRRTYVLVFDPLLLDFEIEYVAALAEGAVRKARWTRVKYTAAFFAAVASRLPLSLASLVRLVVRAG